MAGTALAYLVLGTALAVAGGWSRQTALDQAAALAAHAAVVFVRGVLPAVLATGAACAAWRSWRGTEPARLVTLAGALALALPVTWLLLTSELAGWPRLRLEGAANTAATVALLGAAGAGAELLARRLRPARARARSGHAGT